MTFSKLVSKNRTFNEFYRFENEIAHNEQEACSTFFSAIVGEKSALLAFDHQSVSRKYKSIAVGGTFDQIHKGHRALLDRAFETGDIVYVGLTSDEFVQHLGKKILNEFDTRKARLKKYLESRYPSRMFKITRLQAPFGPGMYTKEIDAVAVSEETFPNVEQANKKRRSVGLPDLRVEVVKLIPADDSKRISSTRIRAGEIDTEGRVLKS